MRRSALRTTALLALLLVAGCQGSKKKGSDAAHTFTPKEKGSSAAQQQNSNDPNKTLNTPAETINGKADPQSDTGDVHAANGQNVLTPGAPLATSKASQQSQSPH